MSEEKLSKKEYWDENLEKAELPRVNTGADYHFKATMDYIHGPLTASGKKTFIEIGCGSSGWLPYFRRRYGFAVSGLDYSEIGCRLAEENMRLLGLPCEGITCADVLKWTTGEKYGVIFSYGVIEHFSEPEKVVGICAGHLEEGGLLITLIPNLHGLPGFLSKTVAPETHQMHKIITPEELTAMHLAAGLENVKTGYAGIFSLALIPWSRSRFFLLKEGTLRARISLGLINRANSLVAGVLRLLPGPVSKLFSPYIIAVFRKPNKTFNPSA